MKHRGNIMEFTDERNRELMRVYREKIARATNIYLPDIYAQVAQAPCSRFWVSEERACVVICAMRAGRRLTSTWSDKVARHEEIIMRPNKIEMFTEIYRRYLELQQVHPEMSTYDLVATVIHQPAPRFYMTARTVGEYIYRIKDGWYNKKKNHHK